MYAVRLTHKSRSVLRNRALQALFAFTSPPVDSHASSSGHDAQTPPNRSPGHLLRLDAASLDEPMVTDRPDFTESTDAVPRGHVQIEAGYTFAYDRVGSDRVRDHSAPELLLRIGLFDNMELRVGWAGYSWNEHQFEVEADDDERVTLEEWSQGANDVTVGAKYKFFDQQGFRPHLGVIGELSLPSGSVGVSAGDVDPAIKILWAYDLSERFGLAGNVNFASVSDDVGRFFQSSASLSFAAALSDRWGGYVEYFGFYPIARDSDCAHTLNGGLTYLVSDNIQIDWRAGFGLNEAADDFFTGVGLAWRW